MRARRVGLCRKFWTPHVGKERVICIQTRNLSERKAACGREAFAGDFAAVARESLPTMTIGPTSLSAVCLARMARQHGQRASVCRACRRRVSRHMTADALAHGVRIERSRQAKARRR